MKKKSWNPFEGACWIKSPPNYGETCPVFRKIFHLGQSVKSVKSAVLYISALGVYFAELGGQRVGDFILAPGWTVYEKRVQYQTYEVTDLLGEHNQLCVTLGKGWYAGRISNLTGKQTARQPALICALHITYQDETVETIVSDSGFQTARSPILFSDIYDGEIYDANIVPDNWENAVVFEHSRDILIPQESEYVREIEEIAPLCLLTSPKGEKIIDFGQNISGYVRFSVSAQAGDLVCLFHAEVLDKDGNFYTENLRSAKQQIRYICKDGEQCYHPHFTFQGFRYIRLDEFPGEIDVNNFRAIVIHTDMKRTGNFECSHPGVNKLFQNIIYGQKSNFVDIPTDCPQRDERLGWTGDAQVFVRAASYNFDVRKFFGKWLADLALEQLPDGNIPNVIPDVLLGVDKDAAGSSAWCDAAVICPWQIYLTYGDKDILARQFDSMKKWVGYIRKQCGEDYIWNTGHHFGDWLALDAAEGSYTGITPKALIATAYFAYSTGLLIKSGEVLGEDMTEYHDLYGKIVSAFQGEFIRDGRMTSKTQTAHALALYFDLCGEHKEAIARDLAEMVSANGNKLTTGFVGTPYLLHALTRNGYSETAYSLLLQEEFPSWLYSVKKGATTVWEHWDGIKPDGSFWSADMNSFNHYAYGAVADFMYEVMAGINTSESAPGFKHIEFRPIPDRRIEYVQASIETKYGIVKSGWKNENGQIHYHFLVPKGCSATVFLDNTGYEIGAGKFEFKSDIGGSK